MLSLDWTYQIEQRLPFAPTEGQHEAIVRFSEFMCAGMPNTHQSSPVMLLRGSAGTGKTSVARAIVNGMKTMRQKVVLLAPTGRAAKVFSQGISHKAYTIHRRIYRQQAYMGSFELNNNMHTDTLFIVDEASMVSHGSFADTADTFGSGNLLDDLIRFVYSGRNCRLMLIGDTAQLPPIGCEEAPALHSDFIAGYGLEVFDYDLMEVLRQSQESGILHNATMLRSLITHDDITELPKISFSGFADISICHGNELIEHLESSYANVGHDETIVITRSNKRANIYNNGIRNRVLWYEEELCSGDELMIVKNNYFWTGSAATTPSPTPSAHATVSSISTYSAPNAPATVSSASTLDSSSTPPPNTPSFLANGDRCIVRRVRHQRELYGFHFADVTVWFPDYDDYEMEATVILDTLQSEAPALTRDQQTMLFNNIMEDYADIPLKQDRYNKMRSDEHFNALQVKYAYAVTCHKAQGGQWAHVYIDQGYMTDDMLTPSYIHWLYTAFTRATMHLYLVNWPKEQTEGNS